MKLLLPIFAALLLISPGGPAAAPSNTATAEILARYDALIASTDPQEAARALEDAGYLQRLRAADTVRATRLLRHLTTFTGLNQMMAQSPDASVLRLAWVNKGSLYIPELKSAGFYPERELSKWVGRYLGEELQSRWREAIFEWDALPAAERDWLNRNGPGEETWKSLPFEDRSHYLSTFANNLANQYMLRTRPLNAEEYKAAWKDIGSTFDLLSPDRSEKLSKHLRLLAALHSGLERVGNVKLEGPLLDQARDEKLPVEKRLAALSKAFDNAKQDMPELREFLPAGDKLRPEKLHVVESMLRASYLRELGFVPDLKKFYEQHPFKVFLRDSDGALDYNMEYVPQEDAIVINRQLLDSWLRGHGWSEKDLLTNPETSEIFVLVSAPIMGHEMLHQLNEHWKRDHLHLPDALPFFVHVQEDELASLTFQATLFNHMLSQKHFLSYVKEELPYSLISRQNAVLYNMLKSNPREFRSAVLGQMSTYAAFPTIDDAVNRYAQTLRQMPKKSGEKYLPELIRVRSELKRHYDGYINAEADAWAEALSKSSAQQEPPSPHNSKETP